MNSTVNPTLDGLVLEDLLANAQIPALPTTAMRLLELSRNPASGPDDYAHTIEADPSLSYQILRFANSSYFGFAREISAIKQALLLLGIRPIRNFSLWSAVYSLVPNPTYGSFDLKSLWQDSLRRAVFSKILSKAMHLPTVDEIFAAALLQDVSIPIFLKLVPEHYEPLIAEVIKSGTRLSSLERSRYGWDHAHASAMLCRNWRLPDEIAYFVEAHTNIDTFFTGSVPQLDACCVALSSLLPSIKRTDWQEQALFVEYFDRLNVGCGIDGKAIILETDTAFDEFAPLLNLPTVNKSLTHWLSS